MQVRLLIMDMYVISGPKSVEKIWKEPELHNRAYKALSVHNMFNMPKDTLAFWMYDDSGHNIQPRPGTQIPSHLRVDYMTHSSITRFLAGDGLKPFARRFTSNLIERLSTTKVVNQHWSSHPDLFGFLQTQLFPASLEAMCGKKFLTINPTFVEDFWAFSEVLPTLAKGYPQWLSPKPYRLRDKCFVSLKQWHVALWAHYEESPGESPGGWSEDYGAEIIRFRHMAWSKMPRMGADGAATEDLGMIWAYVLDLDSRTAEKLLTVLPARTETPSQPPTG